MPCCRCVFHQVFQLTTSRRGRRWQSAGFFMTYAISTHDLTKRSTVGFRVWATHRKYFNSRPHEEVDDALRHVVAHIVISTHDLTKRSTFLRCPFWTPFLFQLTTSRRGRPFLPHLAALNCLISTHDLTKRSTFDFLQCCVTVIIISTHDLTKRSTALLLNCSRPLSFQLTTSRRGRPPCPSSSQSPFSFQLTTSRRGRRWEALLPRWWNLHFNSRPHEEVDVCPLKFLVGHSAISTHDLTKRSTFNGCVPFAYVFISTHDLTKRSTIIFLFCLYFGYISTHDLTKRSTRDRYDSAIYKHISTHDLTKRSTFSRPAQRLSFLYFNSRPHEEVDLRPQNCCQLFCISTHDLTKRSTAKLHILFLTFAFIISTLHK